MAAFHTWKEKEVLTRGEHGTQEAQGMLQEG